jgi:hypothetical protein
MKPSEDNGRIEFLDAGLNADDNIYTHKSLMMY